MNNISAAMLTRDIILPSAVCHDCCFLHKKFALVLATELFTELLTYHQILKESNIYAIPQELIIWIFKGRVRSISK
jgi:hypothetical protein